MVSPTTTPERGLKNRLDRAPVPSDRISIVIATYNRAQTLATTLEHLVTLPEAPPILVVDNASSDGTSRLVRRRFPMVRLTRLERNRGAAARTVGARAADTRYVAFCDDDCWWESGALHAAADLLDAHPAVAVLNARVLVGPAERLDDTCRRMRDSDLRKRSACTGTAIAGFMAGATVMRRSAFLAAGGYHERYHIGAEESLLAVDLLAAGWELIYSDRLVLHHYPSAVGRDDAERERLVLRNRLWTSWLRHSALRAFQATARVGLVAFHKRPAREALRAALRGLPWVLRERRPVAPGVERLTLRLIDPLA